MKATVAEAVEVGTQLPSLTVRLTRERLVRYAGAATDFNPIHYSNTSPRRLGCPVSSLRACSPWEQRFGWSPTGSGSSRVTSYFVRFTRPVVVPDDADGVEVEFSGSVSAIEGSLVTVSIEAISAGQKVLGAARAEVDLGVRVPHRDHEG